MDHESNPDPRWEAVDPDPDASSLAGLGEYSATGGGSQPLHRPRLRSNESNENLIPDMGELGELYRYSLAQATGDDYSPLHPQEQWDEGPLHEMSEADE